MAEVERLFAAAVQANDHWRNFTNIKETPPWWGVGIDCVWVLLGPEPFVELNVTNYRPQLTPSLKNLGGFVFDHFLVPYERRLGQSVGNEVVVSLWIDQRRTAFGEYAVFELLARGAKILLDTPTDPRPKGHGTSMKSAPLPP